MYFNSFPRAGYKWRDISGWELIITFRLRVSLSLDSPLRACVRACMCVRACVFIYLCMCVFVCASMDMKRSSWLSRAVTECRLRPRSAESKAAYDSLASAVLCSEPTECWSLRLCALPGERTSPIDYRNYTWRAATCTSLVPQWISSAWQDDWRGCH